MQTPQLRRMLSIAAIFIAAVVCVQIGLIWVGARDRDQGRTQEIEAFQRARVEEVAKLQAEIEQIEAEVARLQRELAGAEKGEASFENALRLADETRRTLSDRVAALARSLERERPSLDVTLSSADSMHTLAAIAENRGEMPLEVRESRGWLWFDGAPLSLDGSLAPAELEPGGAIDLFEFDPRNRALEFVPGSGVPVKGALCFVYGRMLQDDSAPWVEERWFEYRPDDGVAATIRRDSWPLAEGEVPCQLDQAEPPW